jgi:hypothetical protein
VHDVPKPVPKKKKVTAVVPVAPEPEISQLETEIVQPGTATIVEIESPSVVDQAGTTPDFF